MRWYTNNAKAPGSAVVHFHGGGMVAASVDLTDRLVSKYVAATGVPFLSVDYRLRPEHTGPIPVRDGCAALAWLVGRADEFGVDAKRIAVMGDSGGGGVAAGVAIAARDAGIPLARQILIYPMLEQSRPIPRSRHMRRGATTTTSPLGIHHAINLLRAGVSTELYVPA